MVNPHADYVSFLLKLRRVRGESAEIWTVTLQDTRTQTILSFPDLQTLFSFLDTTFDAMSEQSTTMNKLSPTIKEFSR